MEETEPLSPWAKAQAAFDLWLAAIKNDRNQYEARTKELARDYQAARDHALRVAPKMRP